MPSNISSSLLIALAKSRVRNDKYDERRAALVKAEESYIREMRRNKPMG